MEYHVTVKGFKSGLNAEAGKSPYGSSGDDFMSIPEGLEDELPFS